MNRRLSAMTVVTLLGSGILLATTAGAAARCTGRAYVTSGRETVPVITTATGAVANIEVGGRPYGVAITPDGQYAYAVKKPSDIERLGTEGAAGPSTLVTTGAVPEADARRTEVGS